MKIYRLIQSDCYRLCAQTNLLTIFKQLIVGETFKYLFWMRLCKYFDSNKLLKLTLFPISKLMLTHYKYIFGISLSYRTKIGEGIYFPHFGGIVINDESQLGNNLVISQGVTIGKTDRGKLKGVPVVGDNTFIGPNTVIVGGITIGQNVLIAPNSFVNFNVPDNAVVIGNPGKIVSYNGANEYIKRVWKMETEII